MLTIDRDNFTLRLFKGLKWSKTYGIAVGMAGVRHPRRPLRDPEQGDRPGVARAQQRVGGRAGRAPSFRAARPNNPLKARWMGIANGVGIHGTAEAWSIGTRASHGCIRMHVDDVKQLYSRVPVGTPVLIK